MTSRDLLDAIIRRVQEYDAKRDPDIVLSEQALAESDALVLLVDNAEEESEEELNAFLDALNAVAWLHWARYIASGETHHPSLLAAMALFQLQFQFDPQSVPPELTEQFVQTDMALQPMHELWETMAAEVIEEAIQQEDASDADSAVYLMERALAGLPDGHVDRPRYTINLATALQLRANGYHDPQDVRQAIDLVGEALTATEHDAAVYPSRVALLAGLRKMSFELTGDVSALAKAVGEYRGVVDELPGDHVDRISHLSNLADAGRLLHEATGDPSAADDGLVVLAALRAELRKSVRPLNTVHSYLVRLIRSRFGGGAGAPEP